MPRMTLSLALLALLCGSLVSADVNQQALADVAAGKVKVAKASWWGFDPVDSTKALQAAIDSKVPKLIIDKQAGPWVTLPLVLTSNQEIEFEPGVEVLAKRGAYLATNDSLFTARLQENITLRGYGATCRMWRDDYDKEPYKHAEWRHVVALYSCSNVKILGLTLCESGGDGVYLGSGQAGVTNKDILIKDVVCDKNYRQGISVITAENLLIENTILSNTDGTAPRAGIDFEPNHTTERLVNCVMRNCEARGNAGCGFVAYIPTLDATSAPVSLRLENCRASDNSGPAACFMTGNTPAAAVKGTLDLVNCTFSGPKTSGLVISGNPPTGLRVTVDKCQILDAATAAPATTPILLEARSNASEDVGGIKFIDTLVRDPLERKPMSFVDMSSSLRVVEVTGTLILEKNGQKTPVTITDKLLTEWLPVMKIKRIARYDTKGVNFVPVTPGAPAEKLIPAAGRLRKDVHFVLYAPAGDKVVLTATQGQVGKYSGKTNPLVVTGPDGKPVAKLDVPFLQEAEVSFTAPATGLYHLDADVNPNYMAILKSSHPLNINADGGPAHLFASQGSFSLYVPAGTKEFGVKVFGEGQGEGIKATLLRPNGEVFGTKDDIAPAFQFEVAEPAAEGAIWTLKLERATNIHLEDHYVDLFGLPPYLAPTPEATLKPVQ